MKLHMIKKGIYSSTVLFILSTSALAGHAWVTPAGGVMTPGKAYVGFFGGGGSTSHFDVSQFGTAFYFEASGGPLAVNAFGDTNSRSTWLAGVQVGYQAPAILLHAQSQWAVVPAMELEGYYLGKTTFTGDLTNDTARLPEHDFIVSYPMKRTVFLANAVFNLNIPCVAFHPYAGFGIGGAIVRISGADASQIDPPELGVNHYNSNTSDTDPTFAGQIKLGLSYDINDCINVFAEYRWLYLSNTHFLFGSTVYPAHPETSSWQVKLDPQYSNLGAVGIRFNL